MTRRHVVPESCRRRKNCISRSPPRTLAPKEWGERCSHSRWQNVCRFVPGFPPFCLLYSKQYMHHKIANLLNRRSLKHSSCHWHTDASHNLHCFESQIHSVCKPQLRSFQALWILPKTSPWLMANLTSIIILQLSLLSVPGKYCSRQKKANEKNFCSHEAKIWGPRPSTVLTKWYGSIPSPL